MALSRYFRGPTGIKAGRCSCMKGTLGLGEKPRPRCWCCFVHFLVTPHSSSSSLQPGDIGRLSRMNMGADRSGSQSERSTARIYVCIFIIPIHWHLQHIKRLFFLFYLLSSYLPSPYSYSYLYSYQTVLLSSSSSSSYYLIYETNYSLIRQLPT